MFKKNKDILNIALPAMGENFLQMLMGMVDSYLVAHLGLIAISVVSSSWQYYHYLSGDFHSSGSCYFQCYFKEFRGEESV